MNAPSSEARPAVDPKGYLLTPLPPTPFGKYILIGKLGHGGMAEVNLAVVGGKAGFRKLLVVKRLHNHLEAEPGFIDMFLDEARLAAQLNHPNCVQTVEVGEVEEPPGSIPQHFLAMEYLDGQGLERLLRISGQQGVTIPPHLGARIVADALDGLGYAHDLRGFDGEPLGVVHRDVSPQNIFITFTGVVKLLDFGIAKAESNIVETRTGVVKGKYAYIAPEQALAMQVDRRADLWSMGVVLWEMLTSRRLFKSVNELATLHETLQGEIHPPSIFNPAIPPELDAIVMGALQREVDKRYASAQEFKDALEGWIDTVSAPSDRKAVAALMREHFGSLIESQRARLRECVAAISDSPRSVERLVPHGHSSSGSIETNALTSGSFSGVSSPSMEGSDPMRPRLGQGVTGSSSGESVRFSGSGEHPAEWASTSSGGFAAMGAGAPPSVETHQSRSRTFALWFLVLAACVTSAVIAVVVWNELHREQVVLIAPPEGPHGGAPGSEASATAPTTALSAGSPATPGEAIAAAEGTTPTAGEEAGAAGAPATNDSPANDPPAAGSATPEPTQDRTRSRSDRGAQGGSARPGSSAAASPSTNAGSSSAPTPSEPTPPPASSSPSSESSGSGSSGSGSSSAGAGSAAPGYLSLITSPWTTVTLDGRNLGETPLRRVALPPGTHTLRLRNPDADIDERYQVTIQSGELTSRRLGLR